MNFLIDSYMIYVVSFLCGMGLIVYSMHKLSVGTQSFLNPLIRYFVNGLSSSYFVSFLFGSLIAFSIQSGTSAATMALSFSNSGLVRLRQLKSLLLGSNLGTVLTLFLFTLDYGNLDMYLVAIGFFPMFYSHWPRMRSFGKIIFATGLLLLGHRFMMNHAVINGFHLSDHLVGVLPNLSGLGFVWISILLVVVLSIFFRSTVALLVATMSLLASENISFVMASVFVLAINLGKALPVLRLSQKANVVAKKGALFHGMVHVITTFVLSFFIPETFTLISKTQFFFSDSASLNPLSYVAINHLFYNLVAVSLGTLLFIPVGKIVNRLVGDAEEKEKQQLVFIGNTSHMSPSLAIEQVYQEIKKLAATLETMLQQTRAYIVDEDEESGKRILKYEKITDNVQDEIYDFLDKVMEVSLTPLQGRQIRTLSKMADELEFIADACKSIVLCKKEILSLGGQIDGDFLSEFEKDFDYLISTYEFVFLEVTEQKDLKIEEYRKQVTKFEQKYIDLRKGYLDWMRGNAKSSYEAGIAIQIGDILFNLRKIHSHASSIHQLLGRL